MSKKTIGEQIADLESTRAARVAKMEEVVGKSLEGGRTTDEAEGEEIDTLSDEIKAIDKDLARLKDIQSLQLANAKPVEGDGIKAASESRNYATVKTAEKLEPGIQFARHAMCIYAAKGNIAEAANMAREHYGEDSPVARVMKMASGRSMETIIKGTVVAGTTQDTDYANPLVAYNNYSGDFVEFLRGRTLIGQFGTGSIPALRRIPFNVHIKGQTNGGTGYWTGEGKPKPVTAFGFNDAYHGWYKVAGIAVLTDELIRFSDPSAAVLVRDSLADALTERMDTDFIDPSFTGSANVSPASITNGASSSAASGTDADAVRADIATMWEAAITAKNPMRSAVYITDPGTALRLSLMRNALGNKEFPGITMNGGELEGVPVLVSDYVPVDSTGGLFILVNASDVYFSDDGQATVDYSNQASIQMLDNPTNASDTGTATTMVSMFQTDSTAIRAHRFVNWSRRRSTAVYVLTAVNWGTGS